MPDKKVNIFKVPNLSGRHGRICGGHKREGGCVLPGKLRVCLVLPASRGAGKGRQKSAEGIVGPATELKART